VTPVSEYEQSPEPGSAAPVGRVGVVGAGFMGSGIAEAAGTAGFEVLVHEPERAPLER
jgi:3-hydroxybutyryl-CoA dehydrogenase